MRTRGVSFPEGAPTLAELVGVDVVEAGQQLAGDLVLGIVEVLVDRLAALALGCHKGVGVSLAICHHSMDAGHVHTHIDGDGAAPLDPR